MHGKHRHPRYRTCSEGLSRCGHRIGLGGIQYGCPCAHAPVRMGHAIASVHFCTDPPATPASGPSTPEAVPGRKVAL
jgi:hypothetical protein